MTGRPTTYSEEMLDIAKDYMENCPNAVPSVVGLCRAINRSRSTVYGWVEDKEHPFSDILDKVMELQEEKLLDGGLKSDFNSTITKLMLTKHGYSDKTETDLTSSDGSMTPKGLNEFYSDIKQADAESEP